MKALILVDIQNDFLPGGALAVPNGDALIPVANNLQAAFPMTVATQDWHPANRGTLAATHPGKSPGGQIVLKRRPQTRWPLHCMQGITGTEPTTPLKQDYMAKMFQKATAPGIDSYSGLFDNGHRK